MRFIITFLVFFTGLSTFGQQDKGFYFLLNPNNPFKYYISTYEEIHDYPDSSGYDDYYNKSEYKEWRAHFSMGIEMGYKASNGLIAGIYTRAITDMFDINVEINAMASIGYKFNAPIALHGRAGIYSGNRQTSYALGGIFEFYFPGESDRFDFGVRTGYTFTPLYKDREDINDWGNGEVYITRSSLTYHIVELGMFMKWH